LVHLKLVAKRRTELRLPVRVNINNWSHPRIATDIG
jgi:hypothetical protein